MAVRNATNLTVAMKELAGVKSPEEFIEIQQKLIKGGVQAAVTDSQNIAHLTAAVFTAAFEPVKKQMEAMQKAALHQTGQPFQLLPFAQHSLTGAAQTKRKA
jgi:hypothetical protein